jgi:cyclohexyl-isocyanide hydratase
MSANQVVRWPVINAAAPLGKARMQVGMLAFPGLTLLDLIGPQTVLHGPMDTHLLWKSTDIVESDTGICVRPTMAFADAPESFDILFIPGGPGQVEVFRDPETLAFLRMHGERAQWVTSVCTGALILGAAGLLSGYRAATHWAARDLLPLFGATPVAERVVVDRNRITGGGVTAGIDFGLRLLATILGEDTAKMTQLLMEYAPAPPFDAGTVEGAGPQTAMQAMEVMAPVAQSTMDAIDELLGAANRTEP